MQNCMRRVMVGHGIFFSVCQRPAVMVSVSLTSVALPTVMLSVWGSDV